MEASGEGGCNGGAVWCGKGPEREAYDVVMLIGPAKLAGVGGRYIVTVSCSWC